MHLKKKDYFSSRIQKVKSNDKGKIEDPTKEDTGASVNESVLEVWDKFGINSKEQPPSLRNRIKKEAPSLASLQLLPTLRTNKFKIDYTIQQKNKEGKGSLR